MKSLPAILLAVGLILPLTGRGEMIAPPPADVRAGLEAVGAETEAAPLAAPPSVVTSTAPLVVITAAPLSSEAEAWTLTLDALSNGLPSWEVAVLALLNDDQGLATDVQSTQSAESGWAPAPGLLSYDGLGLSVAASGYNLPEVVGEMIKMRAALSGGAEPFASAGPVGIVMQQYEQDPSPARLRQVRELIERVNARAEARENEPRRTRRPALQGN